MLDATRRLSDAECGRLFRGLLLYSATKEQPNNLQGREAIVFDIYSQQIDREIEKYEAACERNRKNVTSRYESLPVATSRNESLPVVTSGYESLQGKGKGKGEGKGEDKHGSEKRKRFAAPTADEVEAYAKTMGYDGFNAQRFVDYYASKGWIVGRSPMKDWKAAVRGWVSRDAKDAIPAKDNPALDYAQRDNTAYENFEFVDLDQYGGNP